MPLAATLKAGGLKLDVHTANREALRWLGEVANERIHGTTGERPSARLPADQAMLSPLPVRPDEVRISTGVHARAIPIESLQHPLSIYDSLLGVAA